jgi:ferredoxin
VTTTLSIDWTACDGAGLCAELLPEALTTDPWGFPLLREANPDRSGAAAIPAGLVTRARRAVDACPRLALRLTADVRPTG